jgi:hypothetical protein
LSNQAYIIEEGIMSYSWPIVFSYFSMSSDRLSVVQLVTTASYSLSIV